MNRCYNRRQFLTATTALAAGMVASPAVLRAQPAPIRLGAIVGLTGSLAAQGPVNLATIRSVVAEVNEAGGVLGRRIEVIGEDDQSSPDAGVRAARKLIDIDKVCAIMATQSSAVTTAVAPLCWESKTFLSTISGADSITRLPHQGYIIRTAPHTLLQGRKFGALAAELGAKRFFIMAPQTPFTQAIFDSTKASFEKAGGTAIELLIYDDKKPSMRTEVDQAMRFKPDVILAAGYTPDTTVLLKDLYRANYKGAIIGLGYSVDEKMVHAVQPEVLEGVWSISPSPASGSPAYKRLADMIKNPAPNNYVGQVFDQANLIILAMAAAKEASGTAIRDHVRAICQGGGEPVDGAVPGMKLLAEGKKIEYSGASGPCKFSEIGDILDSSFRYEQVRSGKLVLVKIG